MRRTTALAAALLLTGCVTTAAPAPASAATCPALVPAVAHRGGTEKYVENTRNAFRDAQNKTVTTWETDVRFTADNVPVVMHDETVDRTTDGAGAIADLTYAQVAALRTSDGQPVPTLAELLNDAAVDGTTVLVEPKTDPTPAQWTALLADFDAYQMRTNVILISFDGPLLLKARQVAPDLETGRLYDPYNVPASEALQYGNNLIIHHNSVTDARITAWAAAGLDVYTWTVDTASEWERMQWYRSAGRLDGVITNKPAGYLAWAAARIC